MLERIKHIFDIPKIVFVLSIDKVQLGNSIRGYYGSNLIDADEYLKRFIDIEYTLPDPDVNLFCDYLYDHYDFYSYFSSKERNSYFAEGVEKEYFISMAQILFREKKLTLRQVEKIFNNTRFAINMFNPNEIFHPDLFFLLTYLRICENDFYEGICRKKYSIEELVNKVEELMPKYLLTAESIEINKENRILLYTIGLFIRCYNKENPVLGKERKLLRNSLSGNVELTFAIKYIDEKYLIDALSRREVSNWKVIQLSYFTKKINLLDSFNS